MARSAEAGAGEAGAPVMFAGIHHVAIIASDYARSKAFYTGVLGLPVIAEAYRAERDSWKLDLKLGDAQIELFSFPDPPARISRPEACGLRHLALVVDDLDAAVAHLEGHSVACEPIRVDEYTDRRFTFFADPDGLPLELYEG
jgi:glyoxylase I family protein